MREQTYYGVLTILNGLIIANTDNGWLQTLTTLAFIMSFLAFCYYSK